MNSKPKPVAVITGAARGIGRGISFELAKAGFVIAASATRDINDPSVNEYITELNNISPESFYQKADITEDLERKALIDSCYEKFGRLDVLVNNAGIAPSVRSDLLDMTPESFDRLIETNLRGTFFLTQYAANRMIEKPSGEFMSIINITSISAETASINRGEYCISKAALSMTVKLFADRLACHGINVYEIRPGIIETDMISSVKSKYDKLIDEGLLPIKKMGTPADVGAAVTALALGYFSYSTGQIINVDGGFHISRL